MSPIPDTFFVLVPRCQSEVGWGDTIVYRFSRSGGEDSWNLNEANDMGEVDMPEAEIIAIAQGMLPLYVLDVHDLEELTLQDVYSLQDCIRLIEINRKKRELAYEQ